MQQERINQSDSFHRDAVDSRLKGWRAPAQDQSWFWKWVLALAFLSSLAIFTRALWSPFHRADVRFLVLGPDSSSEQSNSPEEMDFSNVFARSNAAMVSKAIHSAMGPALVTSEWQRPLGMIHADGLGISPSDLHPESTLVVYLSGLLAMDRSEPVLSDSSRDASQSGNGLKLISMIDMLRSIRCKQILLCIDATTPATKGPANLAASLVQARACEQIERHLQDSDQTPIAVELRLSYIEHVIHHGSSKSQMANSICSSLEVGGPLNGGAIEMATLEDLQRAITCDEAPHHLNSSSPPKSWLVSANWPLDSILISLPKVQAAKKLASSSPISSDHDQASKAPDRPKNESVQGSSKADEASMDAATASNIEIATMDADAIEGILKDGTADQLLAICAGFLKGWDKSPAGITQDRLHLPAPMSRLYECSFASVRIQKRIQELCFLNKVSPELVERGQVVGLTRFLLSLDRGIPLAGNVPTWIQDISKAAQAMPLEPSSSLVVNATYASLHLMPAEKRSTWIEPLELWISMLFAESDTDALAEWIEQLPQSLKSYDEWKWAGWVLDQPDLSRTMRRDLIFSRLLGTRLACDPLTEHWCAAALQDGDSHRTKAERLVVDRTNPNWMPMVQDELILARDSYQQGIEYLSRIRDLRRAYSAHLAAMILEQPWNHPANCLTNSKHPMDRIRDMDQCLADLASQVNDAQTNASPRAAKLVSLKRDIQDLRKNHVHPHYFGKTSQSHCQLASEQFISTWRTALLPVYPEAAGRVQDAGDDLLRQLEAGPPSSEAHIAAFAEFERKIHFLAEEISEWMNEHAHALPKQSPFWTFASEMLKTNPKTIAHFVVESPSTLFATAQANVQRSERFLEGATLVERRQIEAEYRWWQGIANRATNVTNAEEMQQPGIGIICPDRIQFIAESSITIPVELVSDSTSEVPISVQLIYDEAAMQIGWKDAAVPSGASIDVTSLRSEQEDAIRFQLTVQRLPGLTETKRVVFIALQGSQSYRWVTDVHGPKAPFTSIQLRNLDITEGASSTDSHVLFSNKSSPIMLEATNLSKENAVLIGRMHLANAIVKDVPKGTLTIQEASNWIASLRSISSTIVSMPRHVSSAESQELLFEPTPVTPGDEMKTISEILVEIRDESKDRVQFFRFSPRVMKPSQYVSTQVAYDATRRVLDISALLQSSATTCSSGHAFQCRLFDNLAQPTIANGGFQLSTERPSNRTELTTSGCRSERALLSIDIDGWEGAMLYEIDLSRSGVVQPSTQFAAMQLRDPSNRGFASTDKDHVEVVLDVWMHDDLMEANGDRIQVGLDRNGNRQLDDDAHLELSKPKSIRFAFKGVGPAGRLEIKACVDSHHVMLPIETSWDRKIAAIALIQRANKVIQSNSVPIALDRVAPTINTTRIASSQPLMIGPPILIEVSASDAGLSGTSMVEGCWSTTGELHWDPAFKGIPAVYRDGERWLLTVPTPTLPLGRSVLLIRAIDRAGNASKTYPLTLEVFDANALAARHASITTTVHGFALYGKQTMPGMKIQLSKKEDGEPGNVAAAVATKTSAEKTKSAKLIATTQTGDDGRFSITGIPSGTYELEISGIVKGMRTKRSLQVEVAAPIPPSPIQIRLDQRP